MADTPDSALGTNKKMDDTDIALVKAMYCGKSNLFTLNYSTLNVIGGWLEIGPNYHITVMFDVYNMGQQLDMKFYAKREHLSSSQQL